MVECNSWGDNKNQNEYFFTGLSTDTKPMKYRDMTPPQFSQFYEIDTGDIYLFDFENQQWVKMK